uniref:tRNA pseudouridine(55) synthase n=1 Tax=Aegilops tauschii subsp. strangulata TaxID=200361 RepID=A0A453CNB1_AEGTS
VRMLGSGRPFLIEVLNVRSIPSAIEIQQISDKINSSEKKHVRIRNLKLVDNEIWAMMREGEAEKQKQYAALIWTSSPLTDDDLQKISVINDMGNCTKYPHKGSSSKKPVGAETDYTLDGD